MSSKGGLDLFLSPTAALWKSRLFCGFRVVARNALDDWTPTRDHDVCLHSHTDCDHNRQPVVQRSSEYQYRYQFSGLSQ